MIPALVILLIGAFASPAIAGGDLANDLVEAGFQRQMQFLGPLLSVEADVDLIDEDKSSHESHRRHSYHHYHSKNDDLGHEEETIEEEREDTSGPRRQHRHKRKYSYIEEN